MSGTEITAAMVLVLAVFGTVVAILKVRDVFRRIFEKKAPSGDTRPPDVPSEEEESDDDVPLEDSDPVVVPRRSKRPQIKRTRITFTYTDSQGQTTTRTIQVTSLPPSFEPQGTILGF